MSDTTPLSTWQIVGMVFAIVAALWYVTQDNRAGLREYLTLREHAEYAANARADLKRVEDENKSQVSREIFRSWQEQRTALTNDLQARVAARVTREELTAHQIKDKDILDNLQRQIDQLRAETRAYHFGKSPP